MDRRTSPTIAEWEIAGRGGSWWCSAGTCDFYNLNDIGTMTLRGPLANQGFRVVCDQIEDSPTGEK